MIITAIAQQLPSVRDANPNLEVGGPETADIELIRQRPMDNLKATT